MTDDRLRKTEFTDWAGLVGNIILAFVKGTVGLVSNSKGLLADAVHSASDAAGRLAEFIGDRGSKPLSEEEHAYTHSKAKPIAAIILSVLVMISAVELGISSVKAMLGGVRDAPHWSALIAILVSIAIKEAIFQYRFRLGKKLKSGALMTNAWEHRFDVYSSLTALAGLGGALIGKLLHLPWLYYLDPLAGVLVSALVLKMGFDLIMKSFQNTVDHVLYREEEQELVETVQRVKGVITVDDLRAREQGHYVVVDVKISVNPRITVLEGYDIAKLVKQQLMRRFVHVSDVMIHVSPYDPGYPYKNNVNPEQDDFPTLLH